ncbi:MAG: hypothetical protein CVU26_08255 [Betaproteobacteria bacterium HGW-Betaproteobacteria-2]|nr:MAG: hypothetical protein CVU26_08255 [Betaproteobacteria bacterium HGW-Betaproteobacteria-2]
MNKYFLVAVYNQIMVTNNQILAVYNQNKIIKPIKKRAISGETMARCEWEVFGYFPRTRR